ncbi:DUF3261 domain-containing protein [Agarivorans sp. QJM3NY_33]|uniref:DUF3261 domain-containing protein n=1 Tax=Agarivorans sp. QJM3NY_33 TaxID=3421432 RepID=UPI003D7E2EB0
MNQRMIRGLALALCSLLLSACSHSNNKPTPTNQYQWPSPAELGFNLNAEQVIQAQYGEQQVLLPLALEVNQTQLVVIGFSNWGTRVFSLEWNGKDLASEAIQLPNITLPPPSEVLNDIFLALWPAESLAPMLQAKSWTLHDSAQRREIIQADGKPVMTIDYHQAKATGGWLKVYNHQRNFQYQLNTIAWDQS